MEVRLIGIVVKNANSKSEDKSLKKKTLLAV